VVRVVDTVMTEPVISMGLIWFLLMTDVMFSCHG
jgi:hypothetical protein